MKLCIVSGIFEPEAGGPAVFAPRLASALVASGLSVTIVTFSNERAYPSDASYPFKVVRVKRGNKILNRVRFFFACLPHVRTADCVYLLDWFAAGLPASIAARLSGRPYMVRVGGDYLWEQRYLEGGGKPVSLTAFYESGMHTRSAYKAYAYAIRIVLRGAKKVVFNAEKMRELYIRYYGVDAQKTAVVLNPVPRKQVTDISRGEPTKEFVFWGRFIVMKNVTTLVRAFSKARLPSDFTLTLIGDGPRKSEVETLVKQLDLQERARVLPGMPQREVLERVKDARAFVLPSWTDIAPNQVFEALAIGLPAIVTKENYLPIADQLPITFDPSSVDDLARGLEAVADDGKYDQFSKAFRGIRFEQDWPDVAREHRTLFDTVI